MKEPLLTFFIFIAVTQLAMASDLPNCQNTYRHNCNSLVTYFNGTKYEGEWQGNEFEGWGVFTAPGFYSYVGNFKAGKRNGLGTLTYADQSIKAGIWKNFNLVKSYKELASYKDCLVNYKTSDTNISTNQSIDKTCLKITMTEAASDKQK